jgi:hypothetical protein
MPHEKFALEAVTKYSFPPYAGVYWKMLPALLGQCHLREQNMKRKSKMG